MGKKNFSSLYKQSRDELGNATLFYHTDVTREEDIKVLREMIAGHLEKTESGVAQRIMENWHDEVKKFFKVLPFEAEKFAKAAAEKDAEEAGKKA